MSNYINQLMLERLVEEGLEKGLTQKQAEDYANRIFFNKD
tara:strand:- start:168 stop:287 length:120 start_codon:yes stop_codon:yes gene_type:complete